MKHKGVTLMFGGSRSSDEVGHGNEKKKIGSKVPLSFFYDKKDDWGHNYNNQDFFQYNVERLRYW